MPGASASRAEWEWLLGDELKLVEPLLRATGKLAASLPSLDRHAGGESFDVVRHGDGSIVGVSEDGTRIKLELSDVQVWEVDLRRIAQRLCSALGASPSERFNDQAAPHRQIGTVVSRGVRHPVYLLITTDDEQFTAALNEVALEASTPCVVVTPTVHRIGTASAKRLQQRGGCIVALSDSVAASDDGTFVALESASQALSTAIQTAMGQLPKSDGAHSQQLIVWNGTEHHCELTHSQVEFLSAALLREEIDLTELFHPSVGLLAKQRYTGTKQQRNRISAFLSRLNQVLSNAEPAVPVEFRLAPHAQCVTRDTYTVKPAQTE